eukprot:1702888-Heterocapsa_arctica.AAC.1
MQLLKLGVIRLTMEEAKRVIMAEMQLDHHHMDSPRTKTDRNLRYSVVMAFDPDQPHERAVFKFFKRCDMRDTASFLRKMK